VCGQSRMGNHVGDASRSATGEQLHGEVRVVVRRGVELRNDTLDPTVERKCGALLWRVADAIHKVPKPKMLLRLAQLIRGGSDP